MHPSDLRILPPPLRVRLLSGRCPTLEQNTCSGASGRHDSLSVSIMAQGSVSQVMDEKDFRIFLAGVRAARLLVWEWPRRIASLVHSGTCRISTVCGQMNKTQRFAGFLWHHSANFKTFNRFLSHRFSTFKTPVYEERYSIILRSQSVLFSCHKSRKRRRQALYKK